MKKILFLFLMFIFFVDFNLQSKELSVKECVDIALKNNFDIKIEEFNLDVSKKNIEIEKSYFDKNLIFETNKSYLKKISSQVSESIISSFGISQKLYSGTNYSLRFNTQKQKSNILSSSYQSDILVTLSYPLMEGKGSDINKSRIRITNIELEISNLKLKQKIIDIINYVENAYYNLLYTKEILKVKEKELQSAQEFEREIKEKINVGILPKSDILPAQVKTAQSEADLISAKADFQKAMNNLLILIYPEGKNENVDIGNLQEISSREISFEKERDYAFLNRPDYQILKKNLEKQDINLKLIKNQKLPNLDLISNFGLQGLKENIGDSLKDIGNADFYNYQVGIQLKYPLGNRESIKKYEIEKIKKEQLLLSLKNMEIKINKEIQDAIRDIETASEKLKAKKKSVELSLQNLQQEKEKFRVGLSTIFNVLQYEDAYNNARASNLKAMIDYNIAVSNLNKITGRNIIDLRLED